MLVNHVIDRWRTTLESDILPTNVGRWQTTLKLATKREYVAQWCYYSLFKFTEEDIKKLTDTPSQVLAILEKDIGDDMYFTVKHVAKGLNLNNIVLPDKINEMIDLKNYIYKGK